jgi:hypothetical protein
MEKNEITHVKTIVIPPFVASGPKQQFRLPCPVLRPSANNPWYQVARYETPDDPSDFELEARLAYISDQIEILWDARDYQSDQFEGFLVADAVLQYREERDILRDYLFGSVEATLRREEARKRQQRNPSGRLRYGPGYVEIEWEPRSATAKPPIDKREPDLPSEKPSVWNGIERRRLPAPKLKKKSESPGGQKSKNGGRTINISIQY